MTNKLTQFTIHNSLFTNFAFTLAETLIVMGIIGVVAALTLPNLNSSTGDKEKVAKVKKIYQNLNDAFGRAQAVYGPLDEWFKNDNDYASQSTRFANRMTEFMKISKNCGTSTGCFKTIGNISRPAGDTFVYPDSSYAIKFITADGTAMMLSCSALSNQLSDPPCDILVDIEGPNKGARKLGSDIFHFQAHSEGGVFPDFYYDGDNKPNPMYTECFDTGDSCAAWIIDFGNMDYLKVGTDGKCPDGKTILNGTTNTTCK
ncbi:type II secretion system protein [bacterium]|nr:type II secretion system protein [bacterium]